MEQVQCQVTDLIHNIGDLLLGRMADTYIDLQSLYYIAADKQVISMKHSYKIISTVQILQVSKAEESSTSTK